jgi:release factor glutamine methyltransferase
MQTVLEILKKTTDFFTSKHIEDARLEAEILLAHGLGLKRMDLYLQFDRPLTDEELAKMRPLVQRRGQREPIQHIIGSVGFRHLEIKCDARALIPRPDTEQIIDLANSLIQDQSNVSALEIGVGTGAILLSLIHENPQVTKALGVDISQDALNLAQENATLCNIDSIEWILSDLFTNIPQQQFDLIISNPPYIPTSVCAELEVEVKKYDPMLALDGGISGLDIYERILSEAAAFLKPNGHLLFEIGYDQGQSVPDLGIRLGWTLVGVYKDYGSNDRFVCFKK